MGREEARMEEEKERREEGRRGERGGGERERRGREVVGPSTPFFYVLQMVRLPLSGG